MNPKKICLLTCEDLDRHPSGSIAQDDDHLIRELKVRGFEVEVTPWNHFRPGSDFGIVIVRTTWDYVGRCEEFLFQMEAIERAGHRLFNPFAVLKWNAHKSYLLELSDRGVPVVPSVALGPTSDVKAVEMEVAKWSAPELILKPAVSATSAGLFRIKKYELAAAILQSRASGKDYLIQPYFSEILEGEFSLHFFGKRFSHAVIKRPASGEFRVQEAFGGQATAYTPTQEEVEFCGGILRLVPDPLLVARVDFIQTHQGPLLMELELIEPALFFSSSPSEAPKRFVDALVSQCTS